MAETHENEIREVSVEERKEARAEENRKIEARRAELIEESTPDRELNVFTRIPGEGRPYLPEDAPAAQEAKAFREFQLGLVDNTSENAVKVGLPHPDSQTIPESQEEVESPTELVFTKDTEALPKGAAGGIIADGVFEIVKNTSNVDAGPDATSDPRPSKKSVDAVERFGTHPRRLEDDTHTNQS